jgi:hypothetical protein
VGLAPQTTRNDREANTINPYVLRNPKAVEPQNQQPNPRPPRPAAPASTATVAVRCGQPATALPALAGLVLYIGLDVRNDTIAVSLAPSESTEVRRYGIIGGQHEDVLKLLQKPAATHHGAVLKCCYSAHERAGSLIAVGPELCSHGPRPGRGAIRSAGSSGRTASGASQQSSRRQRAMIRGDPGWLGALIESTGPGWRDRTGWNSQRPPGR